MDISDLRGTKLARTAFGKRGIDISLADVRVQHGVCFVRGALKALPKWDIHSIEARAREIANILRRSAEIKEVILECSFKEDYFRREARKKAERESPAAKRDLEH